MNIYGALTYCNRCGFKIFRRYEQKIETCTVSYIERWKEIDPLPDGWVQYGDEHLCPKCAKDWKNAIRPIDGGKNA